MTSTTFLCRCSFKVVESLALHFLFAYLITAYVNLNENVNGKESLRGMKTHLALLGILQSSIFSPAAKLLARPLYLPSSIFVLQGVFSKGKILCTTYFLLSAH